MLWVCGKIPTFVSMIQTFLEIDRSLLLFFNGAHSSYWDEVMWIYTGKIIWIPLVLSIIYVLLRAGGWRETLWTLFIVALLVVACDQFSSSICKPFFERLRPARDPDIASYIYIVNDYRGGMYGFFSSHASNAAGIVTFTSLLFRNRLYTVTAIIWALITCYSRMYLGVHYPSDIIAGILWGVIVAIIAYKFYLLGRKKIWPYSQSPYIRTRHVYVITAMVYILFVVILSFAPVIGFSLR